MAALHSLWSIGEVSFRVLVQARFRRQPHGDLTDTDIELVAGDAPDEEAEDAVVRAVEIHAPKEEVWPWLAQMMRGAGMYGWRLLEGVDCRSSDSLLAGVPPPRVGDRVGDVLEVFAVEPPRRIAWRSIGRIHCLGVNLRAVMLEYLVQPAAPGHARLIASTRIRWSGVTAPIARHVLEVVDFALAAHQLSRIRSCAEGHREIAPSEPAPARYQACPFRPVTSARPAGDRAADGCDARLK
ncbi:MAG: hypothetical protein ACREID_06745 [Planctomycetota bacterium]